MPEYVKIETESQGQLFKNCGSPEIAGRHSSTADPLDKDFSLVLEHSVFVESLGDTNIKHFEFDFHLTVLAYHSAVSGALNVMNAQDRVKILTLYSQDSKTGRGVITNKMTAKNGLIRIATTTKEHSTINQSGLGELTLAISFEELIYDDLVSNTTGHIKTSTG